MNKAVKISLITLSIGGVGYLSYKLFVSQREKQASERYQEGNTEKEMLINQVLILKNLPITPTNINTYMSYTNDQLLKILNEGITQGGYYEYSPFIPSAYSSYGDWSGYWAYGEYGDGY